jgi:hypothetical protein
VIALPIPLCLQIFNFRICWRIIFWRWCLSKDLKSTMVIKSICPLLTLFLASRYFWISISSCCFLFDPCKFCLISPCCKFCLIALCVFVHLWNFPTQASCPEEYMLIVWSLWTWLDTHSSSFFRFSQYFNLSFFLWLLLNNFIQQFTIFSLENSSAIGFLRYFGSSHLHPKDAFVFWTQSSHLNVLYHVSERKLLR